MSITIACSACGFEHRIPESLLRTHFSGGDKGIRCKRCRVLVRVDAESLLARPNGTVKSSSADATVSGEKAPGVKVAESAGKIEAARIVSGAKDEGSARWRIPRPVRETASRGVQSLQASTDGGVTECAPVTESAAAERASPEPSLTAAERAALERAPTERPAADSAELELALGATEPSATATVTVALGAGAPETATSSATNEVSVSSDASASSEALAPVMATPSVAPSAVTATASAPPGEGDSAVIDADPSAQRASIGRIAMKLGNTTSGLHALRKPVIEVSAVPERTRVSEVPRANGPATSEKGLRVARNLLSMEPPAPSFGSLRAVEVAMSVAPPTSQPSPAVEAASDAVRDVPAADGVRAEDTTLGVNAPTSFTRASGGAKRLRPARWAPIAAALALAAGAWLLLSPRKSHELKAPAEATQLATMTPRAASAPVTVTTVAAAAQKEATATSDVAAQSDVTAPQSDVTTPQADVAAPQSDVAAAPSDVAAQSASGAAPAPSDRSFDAQALGRVLAWGFAEAEGCHRGGRATGTAEVTVTFSSAGKVKDVRVEGEPIASAPVGACIVATLRDMIIPPFQGESFSITRSLTLR